MAAHKANAQTFTTLSPFPTEHCDLQGNTWNGMTVTVRETSTYGIWKQKQLSIESIESEQNRFLISRNYLHLVCSALLILYLSNILISIVFLILGCHVNILLMWLCIKQESNRNGAEGKKYTVSSHLMRWSLVYTDTVDRRQHYHSFSHHRSGRSIARLKIKLWRTFAQFLWQERIRENKRKGVAIVSTGYNVTTFRLRYILCWHSRSKQGESL